MKYEIYAKIGTEINPLLTGWYDTDKGNLFWFQQEKVWSCRNEYVSEEYPKIWYQPIQHQEPDKPEVTDLKQYVTNLLYTAYSLIDADNFDAWVEEQVDNIDQYFKAQDKPESKTAEEIIKPALLEWDNIDEQMEGIFFITRGKCIEAMEAYHNQFREVSKREVTDEEIEKSAHENFTDSATNRNVLWKILGFKRGAKWMHDQMKNK